MWHHFWGRFPKGELHGQCARAQTQKMQLFVGRVGQSLGLQCTVCETGVAEPGEGRSTGPGSGVSSYNVVQQEAEESGYSKFIPGFPGHENMSIQVGG